MKDGVFFITTHMDRLNQTDDTFRIYELGAWLHVRTAKTKIMLRM